MASATRKWETLGFVQRVRANASIDERPRKYLHRCVKLLRLPQEDDWLAFFSLKREYGSRRKRVDADDDGEVEGDVDEDYIVDTSIPVDFNKVIVRGDGEEPLPRFRRNIPTWTAHRTLPNILREVVHDFGTKGMSLVVSTPRSSRFHLTSM